MSLQQHLLVLETTITQDSDAPYEFILPMIFHEIREKEYADSGMNNPHERALNDEILFVLKNLKPEERDRYFKFAEDYRARALESLKKKEEIERTKNIKRRLQEKLRDEDSPGLYRFYQGVRLVWNKEGVKKRIFISTNEETAERINELTEEPKAMRANGSISAYGRKGVVTYQGSLETDEIYKHLINLKKSFSKPFFDSPRLITRNIMLNDSLIHRGIQETRLYNPLDDPKPFDKLKRIIEE